MDNNQGKIDETKGADPKVESQNPLGQEIDSDKIFAFLDDPKFQESIKQAKGDDERFYAAAVALSDIVGEDKVDKVLLGKLQEIMAAKGMLKNEPQEEQEPAQPGEEQQRAPEGQEQEEGAAPEGEKNVGDESTPDENFGENPPVEEQQEPVEGEEGQEEMPADQVEPDEGVDGNFSQQEGGEFHGSPEQDQMSDYMQQAEQRSEKIIQRALRVIEALLREE